MRTKHLRLLLIISLFISTSDLFAQKRLTNREIYNFEVGDILHFSNISSFYDFTRFYKREFLSKEYSNNQDSVIYIVLDSIYELINIPNFKLSVRYDTITYINLDSFPSPSLSSYDSTNDQCGTTIYIANYSVKPPGKQYTELYTDTYMESLGRYYLLIIDSDNTRSENSALQYYKTKDKECGRRIGNLSTNGLYYNKKIDIYPNPVNDLIFVRNLYKGQYKIYNLLGGLIQQGEFENEIEVSGLKTGPYFVVITDDNSTYYQNFLKIQ